MKHVIRLDNDDVMAVLYSWWKNSDHQIPGKLTAAEKKLMKRICLDCGAEVEGCCGECTDYDCNSTKIGYEFDMSEPKPKASKKK